MKHKLLLQKYLSDEIKLLELIKKYKLFYNEKEKKHDEEKCKNAIVGLKKIFEKENFINVFRLDSDNSHDFQTAILKVFLLGIIFLIISLTD